MNPPAASRAEPRIMLDWATACKELLLSCMTCTLTGASFILLSGFGEWRSALVTANLIALVSNASIAAGLYRLKPTLTQARYLYLLGPTVCTILFVWASLQLQAYSFHASTRGWLVGIAGILGFFLGVLLFNRAYSRCYATAWQAEQLRNAEQRQQLLSAELKMLQAQIEPHFLFNTLANLRTLIAIDPPTALTMFDHINEYLRATLARARNDDGSVADEFALLQHYLAIMQMRMGERLAFHIDCPDNVARLPLPPLLVQPLVENAIRHGIEPSIDGGSVNLSATLAGDQLQIQVADTGIGTRQVGDGTSVGLSNIRQRLQALYGETATLQLTDNQPRGTIATLTLPLPR